MRRKVTIIVSYDDHGQPVEDWAYRLRLGGVDVDDDNVRVAGVGPRELRVHYQPPVSARTACGMLSSDVRQATRHDAITCLRCIDQIEHFPALYPDTE